MLDLPKPSRHRGYDAETARDHPVVLRHPAGPEKAAGGRSGPGTIPGLPADEHEEMGDKRKAFEWLRNAVDLRYCNLPNLRNDHDLDSLRGTPKFDQLIADANANYARQFGSPASHSN